MSGHSSAICYRIMLLFRGGSRTMLFRESNELSAARRHNHLTRKLAIRTIQQQWEQQQQLGGGEVGAVREFGVN